MKNNSHKISAHEINRFTYCPYQWYYTRYYGSGTLKAYYQALDLPPSEQESLFEKGRKFHTRYYRLYRLKRALQTLLMLSIVGILIWGIIRWR